MRVVGHRLSTDERGAGETRSPSVVGSIPPLPRGHVLRVALPERAPTIAVTLPKKNRPASRAARLLWQTGRGAPYRFFFLASFASFFSLRVFKGCFRTCFFESWDFDMVVLGWLTSSHHNRHGEPTQSPCGQPRTATGRGPSGDFSCPGGARSDNRVAIG